MFWESKSDGEAECEVRINSHQETRRINLLGAKIQKCCLLVKTLSPRNIIQKELLYLHQELQYTITALNVAKVDEQVL